MLIGDFGVRPREMIWYLRSGMQDTYQQENRPGNRYPDWRPGRLADKYGNFSKIKSKYRMLCLNTHDDLCAALRLSLPFSLWSLLKVDTSFCVTRG